MPSYENIYAFRGESKGGEIRYKAGRRYVQYDSVAWPRPRFCGDYYSSWLDHAFSLNAHPLQVVPEETAKEYDLGFPPVFLLKLPNLTEDKFKVENPSIGHIIDFEYIFTA